MKKMDFRKITLTEHGTMAWTVEYEILRTDTGADASLYEGIWQYDEHTSRSDCLQGHCDLGEEDYSLLAETFGSLGIESWDGYNGNNPNVLDGSSFSLNIERPDGSILTARGTNKYPDNYREFIDIIRRAVTGEIGPDSRQGRVTGIQR